MKLIDLDALALDPNKFYRGKELLSVPSSLVVLCSGLLSFEELMVIENEPVYLVDYEYPENTGWVIWNKSDKEEWREDEGDYGKTWFCYIRRPENLEEA